MLYEAALVNKKKKEMKWRGKYYEIEWTTDLWNFNTGRGKKF